MSNPRFVLVRIDDPTVTQVVVYPNDGDAPATHEGWFVDVPPDDTLRQDVDKLVGWAEAILDGKLAAYSGPKMRERFARLRARFDLDKDDDA